MMTWGRWTSFGAAFVLVLTLSGCAQGIKLGSLFGSSVAESSENAKNQQPGFGKGPLTPPKAAPAIPVEKTALPLSQPPSTSANANNDQGTDALSASRQSQGEKITLGLLLPLSGDHAPLGQAMVRAAQMAAFDAAASSITLAPFDTTKPGGVPVAIAEAVQNKADLIIGPLFAQDIPETKRGLSGSAVRAISLSNDAAQADPTTYIFGFSPYVQIERVVRYTLLQGKKRIAALFPATAYGAIARQAFETTMARYGGVVIYIGTYNPTDDPNKRGIAVRDIAAIKGQLDALLLPYGGQDLSIVAGDLISTGIDSSRITLLGSGLWDDPQLGTTIPWLVGSLYAAADPTPRRLFTEQYRTLYGTEPPRLATLAYDATALAATLVARGFRLTDPTAITNPIGFTGLDGLFRLLPSGAVERGLAVLAVDPVSPRVIEASPHQFTTAP